MRDIHSIEKVQRRFTKRLSGLEHYHITNASSSSAQHIYSLELRRIGVDLIWCYKIVFSLVDMTSLT